MADRNENIIHKISEITIDEPIRAVYDAFYARTNKYKPKFIDTSDLVIERFKLSDYNLDDIFDKTKIQYVGEFPTGIMENGVSINQLWFKRKGETHMSTIRIIPYENKETINNMDNPINVNQVLKTLLSELVFNERTRGILLPILNVDVIGSDLMVYDKVRQYIDPKKYYSVEITEKFYSLTTLDNFIKDNILDSRVLKSIIYQAVDILYQITSSYSKFRYNQMFPETIDCYLKTTDGVNIPELKLSDFFLAEIGELIPNGYVNSDVINIPLIESEYSDLYQLLNYMWTHLNTDIKKYPDLVSLFDIILPKKIRSSEKYLSLEIWDKLSDEEKFDLRIKNIRNGTFFTSRDSLLNTTFVEGTDTFARIQAEAPFEVPSQLTTDTKTDIDEILSIREHEAATKRYEKRKPEAEVYAATVTELDREEYPDSEPDSEEAEPIDFSDTDTDTGTDIEEILDEFPESLSEEEQPDSFDSSELAQPSDFSQSRHNQRIKFLNKKSSNNDIDNMSNKKSMSRRKQDNVYGDEQTEDRQMHTRPSRIISVTDTVAPKRKLKSYRGTRYINTPDNSNLNTNLNSRMTGSNTNAMNSADVEALLRELNDPSRQYNNSGNIQSQMQPQIQSQSRINSIGDMLGVTPNELNNMNQNMNYGQIAQKLSQQYQVQPQNMSIPGQFSPQTVPSQMGQIGQMGQADDNYLARYLAASQGQLASNQSAPNQSMPNQQMDPNYMAYLMQQQQQQQQPNNQMLPPMTGGSNNKPFFFQ